MTDPRSTDRGPTSLASKNPFRNLVSEKTSTRPISTNPFLDSNEISSPDTPNNATTPTTGTGMGVKRPDMADKTADIFASLDISEPAKPPQPRVNGAARRENIAPRPYPPRGPPPRHRPSNSEEERRRQQGKPLGAAHELDIFADPPEPNRPRERRPPPRRNSESSIREKPRDLDPEAEKRRRERKLREGKSSHRSKKPNARLDIIDKLDVTSIYGTGLFHHDGPFDACNPHRNRKGSKQAPMQAFPKDSLNMQLGGSGPVHKQLNLDQYHGTGREANLDYNDAAVYDDDGDYFRRPQPERSASFNPTARTEPLHGSETAGLGTSTFLEGAPASRAAIQRRDSEQEAAEQANAAGLSRKKSLAQRIKAVRPKIAEGGRMTSPEPTATPTSPMGTSKSEQNGSNPFFKDHDKEFEKKGAQIAFGEEQAKNTGRARAPSSPKRAGLGLERRLTSEGTGPPPDDVKSGAAGFLSRVKSIKGGRSRTRERRNTEAST
ncbi:uncharacterized protein Z519_10774 [Cladophialophora bantiana CBS 173.52]|uniref:Pal1 cell morphology protein n=1 Tax=Cladophialophora bantiana (strain ATCC 10958 / CBS 173.52 / CDC B-1940 / NIH 8579) TaxID=1442370 RepID=A0A0D2H5X5_CLAB1|nr:uncharacterized protein Z519_10774 [Cladophialophora bantiana CBS 173.52]KIW88728.1 hypothetical protein Z519_10774 [Cladophialophora bantiana CBS 173.52]